MTMSLNEVNLIGNCGKKPEIRTMQDGAEMALFNLATTESWYDKDKKARREKTEWHKIVVFQKNLVNIIKSYVFQGSKLYVRGSLHTRKWVDSKGIERLIPEIVLDGYSSLLIVLDKKSQDTKEESSPEGFGSEVFPLSHEGEEDIQQPKNENK